MSSFAQILIFSVIAELTLSQPPQCTCVQMRKCLEDRANKWKQVTEQCMNSPTCSNVLGKMNQADQIKTCIKGFHEDFNKMLEGGTNCTFSNSKVCAPNSNNPSGESLQSIMNRFRQLAAQQSSNQVGSNGLPPPRPRANVGGNYGSYGNNGMNSNSGGNSMGGMGSNSGMGGMGSNSGMGGMNGMGGMGGNGMGGMGGNGMGGKESGCGEHEMPQTTSPQMNAFYECIHDCTQREAENMGLYKSYPEGTARRRKRSPEMMHTDVQYCAVQEGCHLDMFEAADAAQNCMMDPSKDMEWDNMAQKECMCLQRALGMNEESYPCMPDGSM